MQYAVDTRPLTKPLVFLLKKNKKKTSFLLLERPDCCRKLQSKKYLFFKFLV